MLDGRIDTQGAVKDLQEQGVLEPTHPGILIQTSEIDPVQGMSTDAKGLESTELPKEENWKPRKLVQASLLSVVYAWLHSRNKVSP